MRTVCVYVCSLMRTLSGCGFSYEDSVPGCVCMCVEFVSVCVE